VGVIDLLTILAIVAGLIALYFIIQAVIGALKDTAHAVSDAVQQPGLKVAEAAGEAAGFASGVQVGSGLGIFNVYNYPFYLADGWRHLMGD
jgi:hypothetical protein